MARVMAVEDDTATRRMLVKYLKYAGYTVLEAENGAKALELLEQDSTTDVILMDISMPVMDGIEATKRIRTKGYPVVILMLTALADELAMEEAARAGADDFLRKPVNFKQLNSRIELALKAATFYKHKHIFESKLFKQMELEQETINKLRTKNEFLINELLEKLYILSEFRDDETHEHTLRVGWICGRIAKYLKMEESNVMAIQLAAPLHDIGKIGIPDAILLKPAKLTTEEFEKMKKHTEIGYKILKGSSSQILKMAATIALTHHERWDGSGYPKGLKGEEIPIEGLIVGVADSFDAIVSKRPYKEAKPLEEGFKELRKAAGKLYSPDVIDAFQKLGDEIYYHYEKHKGP
jgi:putative two-component system response regulator